MSVPDLTGKRFSNSVEGTGNTFRDDISDFPTVSLESGRVGKGRNFTITV